MRRRASGESSPGNVRAAKPLTRAERSARTSSIWAPIRSGTALSSSRKRSSTSKKPASTRSRSVSRLRRPSPEIMYVHFARESEPPCAAT